MLGPVPFLHEVLKFEHSLIRAALYGEVNRSEWNFDPAELFRALEAGQVPSTLRPIRIAMDIVPES